MEKRPSLFIVTSVIKFINQPLSYIGTRSQFNPDDRARQTLDTVLSIRRFAPGARIALLEAGLDGCLPPALTRAVDEYHYLGRNPVVRMAVDGGKKGLGEAVMLLAGARRIRRNAGYYFKISGRYFLNDRFNAKSFVGPGFAFKRYGRSISTRLYGFSRRSVWFWVAALVLSLPIMAIKRDISIEFVMPLFIRKRQIRDIAILGVQGFIAPAAEPIAE